ncbi:MAG: damage-inducible protein CinA [Chitinophagaceae bacterium]
MNEVHASIITIGDELLIGQTIDTNSAFIGQELNKIGVWVKRRIAVGDVKEEILNTLAVQSKDNQIIIITGGLGPTADDITKPALCEYFNSHIIINDAALRNVKDIFTRLNRPLIERNLKQAEVPHNCTVLQNKRGTAPGMWFEKEDVIYVSLPGVPHEMRGLITDSVVPKLRETFLLPFIIHKTALVAGKGESEIAELIKNFEEALPKNIKLAYLPAYGMVRLRLTAKGDNSELVTKEVSEQFQTLQSLVKDWLVADEDISLQEALEKLLEEKKLFVGTAESCTGGYIAHLLTARPGASKSYKGTVVSYANETKEHVLGVSHETLIQHGAVSEETVTQMAKGAVQTLNVDYAIATSGIMGPEGGSHEKPVGTVWIAVANRNKVKAAKFFYRFDRQRNIQLTANAALNMLRLFILEEEK